MKISNIKISYPKNDFVLDIPAIELQDNKINCLIGDNGSGKSTLLKQIIINHKDDSTKYLMLQKPYIFSKTVKYNIELVSKLAKSNIDIKQIVKDLNLVDLMNKQTNSLSGGQKQRLAFAMALISDYDLIMLDEPFNNIDLKSQRLMIDLMKKTNKTYLIVVHNINLAYSIADYFFFMQEGKIVYEDTKEKFFNSHYLDEFKEME